MANGGSLGGLCGEGQRLAVALLQYICAKIGQHWWGTPADRPTSSPRRLRTSIPHHGERGEPGRAVWREAAPSSGAPGAFSASRSEGPDWLAERATRRDPSGGRPVGRATRRKGDLYRKGTHRKVTHRKRSSDGRAKITKKKVFGSTAEIAARFTRRRRKPGESSLAA